MTILTMFTTLLTSVIVSNYMKFTIFALVETWLIAYTSTHLGKDDMHELMLLFLHVYVVINVLFTIIQQTVLVKN